MGTQPLLTPEQMSPRPSIPPSFQPMQPPTSFYALSNAVTAQHESDVPTSESGGCANATICIFRAAIKFHPFAASSLFM